ncbi:hypothetical protein SAMN05421788_104441 [Filimonas lacunae]|uniref:Uncharacterized protein n=1 Tax=Filimonas lacunae TaxID=477680 RepID=A0A173MRY2_9BACT|nr:hypothetical protein [Filimonas lacunae]BAV10189.1 hypothetical protein FLA_6249 [Filimonas lacunae]SIT18453.1 hypothetical protein SAMN05421788_104441 [Filimonas lacunae]
MKEYKQVLDTHAGMWALWNPAIRKDVQIDKKNAPAQLALTQWIKQQLLVPVNIENSGSLEFWVRVGREAKLTDRERRYVVVSSAHYGIVSDGRLCLSGIEYVRDRIDAGHVCIIDTNHARHVVTLFIIDWKAEPGMLNSDGVPSRLALPDFIVLISQAQAEKKYRLSLNTFG